MRMKLACTLESARTGLLGIAVAAASLVGLVAPQAEAAEGESTSGMAVNVARAERRCFEDTLQMSGVVTPRREVLVRPEREGMQITSVLVDLGQNVTSGQTLARLTVPEGQPTPPGGSTTATVTAPVAGRIVGASAVVGAAASARGEPLFRIAERGDMELVVETPVKTISRLAIDQSARIEIIGITADLNGRVRHLPTEINPMTQLGQVHIMMGVDSRLRTGAFGRAIINLGRRCGPSVPLSAVLYGSGGSIVQVVRDGRIESRRVNVGLLSGSDAEIRDGLAEGDTVVSRAGAFVRDGDRVRPIQSSGSATR
jgi:HlyD family secretion protein